MLLELYVKDFALIEELRLEFSPGLNILTGETGAGKSMVIDAVELLLGGRASSDWVRTGRERAVIEALFDIGSSTGVREALEKQGFDASEQVLLTREISARGRNVCRVNGRTVTASMLRDITEQLIDLHGQHEHQSLLKPSRHLVLLDEFAGQAAAALKARVRSRCAEINRVESEIEKLSGGDPRERAQRVDLLEFQIEEIDRARLRVGEEEELRSRRRVLSNAEKLKLAASRAYALIYDGEGPVPAAVDRLAEALAEIEAICELDDELGGLKADLEDALLKIQEMSRPLAGYVEMLEYDPRELEEVENRLNVLSNLKRKYGDSIEEVLEYRDRARRQLEEIRGAEGRLAELGDLRARLIRQWREEAEELSEQRRKAAAGLAQAVQAELQQLGMPRAVFEVSFSERGHSPHPEGLDEVEFLISPNPGEEPRPLARVASGGEMARVMLALKTVLASADDIPVLIFDEIDAGIGGRAAHAVGERMARVAKAKQVLAVTHLAQIAVRADTHFLLEKEVVGGRTVTRARPLDFEERVYELARMMGGGQEDTALTHARSLLEKYAQVG